MFSCVTKRLWAKPGLCHDFSGAGCVNQLAFRCWRWRCGLCVFLAALPFQDCHDIAGCWPQARVLPVPIPQAPHNLLPRPVLQFIAPPCQLRGIDVLGLVWLKVCAQNNAHLRSKICPVFAQILLRKRCCDLRCRRGNVPPCYVRSHSSVSNTIPA
jgi:hypothetical protein